MSFNVNNGFVPQGLDKQPKKKKEKKVRFCSK